MWVAAIMQGFAQAQVTNTLPFVRLSLEMTEGQMSSLLAIARLGAFLAFPFTLRGDRYGRRGPFLIAFAILMAANAATALAYQPSVFAGLQALVRMGTTAVGVLATVLIVEQLSPQVRAYGLSIYGAGGSFGAGIALLALPIARLGDESWRLLFAASVLGLLLLPFLARQVRESPIHDEYDLGRTGLLAPLSGGNRRNFVILCHQLIPRCRLHHGRHLVQLRATGQRRRAPSGDCGVDQPDRRHPRGDRVLPRRPDSRRDRGGAPARSSGSCWRRRAGSVSTGWRTPGP